jgi:hypothetical protein
MATFQKLKSMTVKNIKITNYLDDSISLFEDEIFLVKYLDIVSNDVCNSYRFFAFHDFFSFREYS